MIKRLRKKFIIITTISVFVVIFTIVGIINIINYVNVVKNSDTIVSILKDGNGKFGNIGDEGENSENDTEKPQRPISPEMPFETRFFTIVIDNSGAVIAVNTDKIAAVDREHASDYALSLYKKNKTKGFYENYRYGTTTASDGSTMYIFVDCSRELSFYKFFMFVSFTVGIAAFALIFVLVFFLSYRVTKPIAESYAKQRRFITDASHELKTPLTVIGADTEILKMQGDANEWIDEIKNQVNKLSALTEKLVFLARMDEDDFTLTKTDFSITDAVEETIKPFCSVAVSKGLSLESDIQPNVSYCGDESMIRRLVSLLTDNALKYSTENSAIKIRLKTINGKIQFLIENFSEGLNGDLSILFERFYRIDAPRNSETGGQGIGLSVAQAIVAMHKGKIKAYGENGKVTFTVTL